MFVKRVGEGSMDKEEMLRRITASWYALASNVAGNVLLDVKIPLEDLVEEVAYYLVECPGRPSRLSLASILGKEAVSKFTEVLARVGLRPTPLFGLEPDDIAYVFALAGLLAEAELLGDSTAPAYRLWLVDEIIEKVAEKLKGNEDYCIDLLASALKALIEEDERELES